MAGYRPIKITGNASGLVQNREEFILPNDAYPVLQNAYVWRERIKRKKGCQLLGRLQREPVNFEITLPLLGTTDGSGNFSGNIFTAFASIPITIESSATFVPGSIQIHINGDGTFIEPAVPNGTLSNGSGGIGTFNYVTGDFTLTTNNGAYAGQNVHLYGLNYYTNLPVMGIRLQELQNSAADQTIVFDQVYAYVYAPGSESYQEFIPGTTWNMHDGDTTAVDFFWSTNYWISGTASSPFSTNGKKLFWVTNNTGQFGADADPPRITDGSMWVDFYPSNWSQIDATNYLVNFLAMLPFRGRMVTFNTWEGTSNSTAINYSNRIRWSTIGNPFIPYAAGPPAVGSWRSDIRGQGGFLDIPTSEDITAVGFVRDNLVIYCERSTWQLRYTGRSIAPFQIERVNSELGAESLFSAVQFDTSLVGIGDKGIIECDSYQSKRIDIKIPDLVFSFQYSNNGTARVQGIRDFPNRLAYWTYVYVGPSGSKYTPIFPNSTLVYNYENDSWAIFTNSFTVLGNYQLQSNRTWLNTPIPWIECEFTWIDDPEAYPAIIAGNQQGFVEILNQLTTNDITLAITAITANTTTPTVITSVNHNLQTGNVIQISGIPSGTPFDNLNRGINPSTGMPYNTNNGIFGIIVNDANNFQLLIYNGVNGQFNTPQLDVPDGIFVGIGSIAVRDNFSIMSKKFNFLDEGQSIQMGYIDILMMASEITNPGAISMNVYLDYNDIEPSNTLPLNDINEDLSQSIPDTFFNSIIPTTESTLNSKGGTKFWQRVYCPTRANFLTIEYTFSNAQLAGGEPEQEVQIDAQVLWIRQGGRMTQI